jgi:hypothetical protein
MKGVILLLLLGLCFLPGHIFSQAGVPNVGPVFLDLPDGFGQSDEEEDEPELIEFYENEYEGDAFFFCLDKSDSMSRTTGGQAKWAIRNRETIKAIQGLTRRSVVTVLFFDFRGVRSDCYGDPPLRMDPANKARLIGQITATTVANHSGSDSCIGEGMKRILQIANKTQNKYRVIMLVADGRAQCPTGENDPDRVFASIMSLNAQRIPINTVYTGPQSGSDWEYGKPLLERLARATNGKFKIASS